MRAWYCALLLALASCGATAAQAPGQAAKQPPPGEPAWVDPDKGEPAGTKYRTFFSKTLGADVSYLIYLPPEYEAAGQKRFPVVYWLHGLGGNQRGGAVFVSVLNEAIKAGRAPAMIAVLVNGMRDSRYVDSADGQRPVETVIVKDLLPHIDNAYRTTGNREGRAIEGYSMGGFGAARLGFKFPDLFGAVSIMAGALMDNESAASMRPELFQKNFGGDLKYFRAASPWTLVENNADGLRGRTFVRIGVGKEDNLMERNEKYHKLLERLGIEHEFFVVPGVAHNGALFYKTLGTEHFRFYQKAFAPGKK